MLALITCLGGHPVADHMSCHQLTKTLHDLKHFIPHGRDGSPKVFVLYSDEPRQLMVLQAFCLRESPTLSQHLQDTHDPDPENSQRPKISPRVEPSTK